MLEGARQGRIVVSRRMSGVLRTGYSCIYTTTGTRGLAAEYVKVAYKSHGSWCRGARMGRHVF